MTGLWRRKRACHFLHASGLLTGLDTVREEMLNQAVNALRDQGFWVGDGLFEDDLIEALRASLDGLREDDALRRAGIGREDDFRLQKNVRGDRIHWLSRQDAAQARFLDQMERLRLALNRALFLGLFEFESHFAHYPPGAFYRRHYDSFRGAANRLISTVLYLNPDWQPGDGGELVLYAPDEQTRLLQVEPIGGRLALFLSEEVAHEVLPAARDRLSIAGWFRLNASTADRVDPPR